METIQAAATTVSAISKQLTLPNGAIGSYWKITRVALDLTNMDATYSISIFVDKLHADSNLGLGLNKTFTFAFLGTDVTGDMITFGYNSILAFANAINPITLTVNDPDLAGGTTL